VLTVVDQFTLECILLLADQSLTAAKVACRAGSRDHGARPGVDHGRQWQRVRQFVDGSMGAFQRKRLMNPSGV
jgi:hypothetical protein